VDPAPRVFSASADEKHHGFVDTPQRPTRRPMPFDRAKAPTEPR